MIVPEALQRVAAELNRAGIPYSLTGSFASVFYGSPRSTQDIDLVIEANSALLRAFIESLPRGEYYAEADAALEALKRESMFNIIDLKTSWKIDMIIRKSQRQIDDAAGILRLRGASLDRSYLDKCIRDLGLAPQWNAAQRIAES